MKGLRIIFSVFVVAFAISCGADDALYKVQDGYKVDFTYTAAASTADYMRVQMAADSGPMSTRDYRLALEATPLDAKHSFLHMSYSYAYGIAARLAMQTYLSTVGSDKVGFSVTGTIKNRSSVTGWLG